MKKVSTAAAQQIRNFCEQKPTIGLDLGDRSSWYCVDAAGEVALEQKLARLRKTCLFVVAKQLFSYRFDV